MISRSLARLARIVVRAEPPAVLLPVETADELLTFTACGGVRFDLAAIGGAHDALLSRRTCASTCPFVFGDALCGVNVAAATVAECDHAAAGCIAHGNIERFGGFALIPVINPWAGLT
jgi:hypothetical protein